MPLIIRRKNTKLTIIIILPRFQSSHALFLFFYPFLSSSNWIRSFIGRRRKREKKNLDDFSFSSLSMEWREKREREKKRRNLSIVFVHLSDSVIWNSSEIEISQTSFQRKFHYDSMINGATIRFEIRRSYDGINKYNYWSTNTTGCSTDE